MAEKDAQLPGPITPVSKTAKCSEHEGQALNIYCTACKVLICAECLDEGHGDHSTTSAKKQFQALKKEVATLMFTASEQTKERREAMKALTDMITKDKGDCSAELQKRTKQQTDAVAQLDTQYQQLLAEAEGIYKRKRAALVDLLTKSYKDENDERIKFLEDASRKIEAEYSELEDIISAFRTQLDSASGTTSAGSGEPTIEQLQTDCEALTMADVADWLPKLQTAVTSQLTSLPETKTPAPIVVPEVMKNYNVKLDTSQEALETLRERADELLATSSDDYGAVVETSFYEECQEVVKNNAQITPKYTLVADPGKAYKESDLKLTRVSEKAGKELARLFGGGDVLVREGRHKGQVLRTTTGTVTHVRAYAGLNIFGNCPSCWFPAGVSVVEAVRLAGVSCSRVTDLHSKQDVTNTNTLAWCDSSPACQLQVLFRPSKIKF